MIADVGAPPPRTFSREAHAGCLSFELSSGRSHIVVNCGAPGFGDDNTAMAARSTAAHSTATVADASSCRFAGRGTRDALGVRLGAWLGAGVLSGPRDVKTEPGNRPARAHAGRHARRLQGRLRVDPRAAVAPRQVRRSSRLARPFPGSELPSGRHCRYVALPSPSRVKATRSQDECSAMLLLARPRAWRSTPRACLSSSPTACSSPPPCRGAPSRSS